MLILKNSVLVLGGYYYLLCIIIYWYLFICFYFFPLTSVTVNRIKSQSSQVLQIKCTWITDHKRGFGSLLVWNLQVYFNTIPRRKNISSDLKEVIFAANQSVKGYSTISKWFEGHHATVRKNILKWKTFKTGANLPWSRSPGRFTQMLR